LRARRDGYPPTIITIREALSQPPERAMNQSRRPAAAALVAFALGAVTCNDGSGRYAAKLHHDAGGTGGATGGGATEVDADPGPGSGPTVPGEGGSGGTAPATGGGTGGAGGGAPPAPTPAPGPSPSGPGGAGGASSSPRPPDGGSPRPDAAAAAPGGPFQMLILSKALEYRHDSITACQQMLRDLGNTPDANLPAGAQPGSQWTVTIAREDLSQFNDEGLKPFAILFWCNPTGTVFTAGGANGANGKLAVQKYLTGGGAWGGVHSATDFENTQGWTWFQDQVNGGNFVQHDPDGTPNSIVWQPGPLAQNHPVIRGIRSPWSCADEWYRLNRNPETLAGFTVLGKLGTDQRPAVYVREIPGGGRSFYTIRGHNSSVYAEPNFRRLIHQGVLWAVRRIR
jgi:hypothetical protein